MRTVSKPRWLAVWLALACQAAAPGQGREDDQRQPPPLPLPDYTLISSALAYPMLAEAERAAAIIERINQTPPDRLTIADVVELYRRMHYEMVRTLPEKGLTIGGKTHTISQERSRALALLRDTMINEVYKDLARDLRLDCVRLDFGNKLSGVKSDVDHTAYTDFDDPRFAGKNIRAEVERRFQARWQISQAACDICVHSGRNSIPDWRGAESVADFDARMIEVLRGLAGTPDAYVAEGAWRLQVEMRSLAGAEKVLKTLDGIERELKTTGLTPEQRQALEARRAEALEGNPCTKFTYDPNARGEVTMSKDGSILRELFRGVQGDVLRMYAFDVAIGNYLFHIHHEDKLECTKYVLRAFEEGVFLLRQIGPNEALKPLEYGKLADDAARRNLIVELFPAQIDGREGYTGDQRAMIKRVLDIANKLRENHKAADGVPPHSVGAIWGPMAAYLKERAGGHDIPDQELLRLAQAEYARASTEVMVLATQRTAAIRTTAWLEPGRLSQADLQLLGKIAPGVTTETLQRSGFYALKYAFAHLPPGHVERIIQGAPPSHRRDLEILRDVVRTEIELYGRVNIEPDPAQERSLRQRIAQAYQAVKDHFGNRYADFRAAAASGHYTDEAISARVWASIFEHLGMQYELLRGGVEGEMARWTGGWNPRAAFRSFLHEGNILSALNVLRVYQQGGDRDAVLAALVWEGLYRVPGLCHLFAARDGVVHGNWHGAKFLVSAAALERIKRHALARGIEWAKPLGSSTLIYFMIAKTAMEMIAYEVFTPLTNDLADMMYRGKIGIPPEPPKPTGDELARIATLERLVERGRQRMAEPDFDLQSAEGRKVVDDTRGYMASLRELQAKKKTWDDWDAEAARWRAGLVLPGIRTPIEAQAFDPLIGPQIPLKFYLGTPDTEPEGPVDLTAKPLTAAEQRDLERQINDLALLRSGEARIDPFARVEAVCNRMDEIDRYLEQKREAERARRCLERLNADQELLFQARRQNLCNAVNPTLDRLLQNAGFPAAGGVADLAPERAVEYFTAREREAPRVVANHVTKWFDEEHPQVRGLALLRDALPKVIERMKADYEASEDAREQFEQFQSARLAARSDRQERRRVLLRSLLIQQGMAGHAEAGREHSGPLGTWTVASPTPVAPPVVRLTGAVGGQGADKTLSFRVKTTASALHYKEPYKVTLRTKPVQRRPDGTLHGLLVADVHDADGKLIGAAELPVTAEALRPAGADVTGLRDWPFPPRLRVTGGRVSASDREVPLKAELPGVPEGHYRLTATAGERTYIAWGKVERRGGTAFFTCPVPVPAGTTRVTVTVPGVPPVTFEAERKVPQPRPSFQPQLTMLRQQFARAKAELEQAKAAREPAASLRPKIASVASSGASLAKSLGGEGAEAEAVLADVLAALPPFDERSPDRSLSFLARRDAIEMLAKSAYAQGKLQDYRNCALWLIRLAKANLAEDLVGIRRPGETAEQAARNRQGRLNDLIILYGRVVPRLIALGGRADEAKALWAERAAFYNERYGPGRIPDPAPDWGPE